MNLNFQPLSLNKQNIYRQLFEQCPQKTSDYSFINLWSWRDIYQLQWAWQEDLVWIRQLKPETIYWAPVGPWEQINWKSHLSDRLEGNEQFTRLPEQLSQIWEKELGSNIELSPNQDHWDYVYSVQELIQLQGKHFHKKKNLLNQFKRKYSYQFIQLDAKNVEKPLTLQTEWCLWRDCESSTTLQSENQAILRTLEDWSKLEGIMGAGLEVEGHLVAFTVAEPLDNKTMAIHFEKGCPEHKGVYQAINQMFLAECASEYTYVNREQDLGDVGLRKAKMSYNPKFYLKKFSGQAKSDINIK